MIHERFCQLVNSLRRIQASGTVGLRADVAKDKQAKASFGGWLQRARYDDRQVLLLNPAKQAVSAAIRGMITADMGLRFGGPMISFHGGEVV